MAKYIHGRMGCKQVWVQSSYPLVGIINRKSLELKQSIKTGGSGIGQGIALVICLVKENHTYGGF